MKIKPFAMAPALTGPIPGTDIYAVNSRLNDMFVLPGENGACLAIDAGSVAAAVKSGLGQLGVDPLAITDVLLTHSDYDHMAGLSIFTNAHIHMGAEELQMVDGRTKRSRVGKNSLPPNVELEALDLLADGQELTLGGYNIRCIAAPGHTPGSMIYLLDGKYLFTGDACRVCEGKLRLHPFTMDKTRAQKSLQVIEDMREKDLLMLTAHYGYYSMKEMQ